MTDMLGALPGYEFLADRLAADKGGLTDQQELALRRLCARYEVDFDPEDYKPACDLPDGWVSGWVGGITTTIYVGASPDGDVHS